MFWGITFRQLATPPGMALVYVIASTVATTCIILYLFVTWLIGIIKRYKR